MTFVAWSKPLNRPCTLCELPELASGGDATHHYASPIVGHHLDELWQALSGRSHWGAGSRVLDRKGSRSGFSAGGASIAASEARHARGAGQ